MMVVTALTLVTVLTVVTVVTEVTVVTTIHFYDKTYLDKNKLVNKEK